MSKMPAPQSFPSQKRNQSRNGENNDESVDMEMSDDDASFGDDIGWYRDPPSIMINPIFNF